LNYAQKQAHEQGLAEGRAEEKINIALKLKKAGADIALIILSTGLSEEEIEKL
jgi:predicted transposase YdaD